MKIYRKLSGFTLIELLVVFAIIGILAGISVPGMMQAQVKNRYETDVKEVYDMLLEARTNAVAGMTCEGTPSSHWSLFIEKKYGTENANARITCFPLEGNATGYLSKTLNYADVTSILFDDNGVGDDGKLIMEETENSGFVSVEIRFLTGQFGARLFQRNRDDGSLSQDEKEIIPKKKVKIIFYNQRIDSRSLCFSRIAGYPTLNKNSDQCLE